MNYQDLVRNDVVYLVEELLRRGSYKFRDGDGKLVGDFITSYNTPWRHVKHLHGYDCEKWHRVMFDIIGAKLPQRFVPSRCQECWKVVVRPRTLKELFHLLDIQLRLNRPSKCGIERRETVHGLYGGYFYNRSIEEGMERYVEVRREVDEHISPDVVVILKRGCTEFEHACGDSKYWKVEPWQAALEEVIEQWICTYDMEKPQPELVLNHVYREWIEFAYANGDGTYKEFTGGKPLYPALRTYHHLVGASEEEKAAFWVDG